MPEGYRRPLPLLNDDTRPFWTGGASGELRITHCESCGLWIHPPRPICPACLSQSIRPDPVSGFGTVETFTINYRAWAPDMRVPYVIAIIALDEQPGLRLTSNIIGIDAQQVSIGQRVRVTFVHDDDVWLPLFYPVTQSAGTSAQ